MTTQAPPRPLAAAPPARAEPAGAMLATGLAAVVAGGVVAAFADPLDLYRGSWLAAFLVLVVGVAQAAMGLDRTLGAGTTGRAGWLQWGGWNLGSALVVAGTLTARPWLVDVGSIALVAALVLALAGHRAGRPSGRSRPRGWRTGYPILLLILTVCIPIGIVLSHLRHS